MGLARCLVGVFVLPVLKRSVMRSLTLKLMISDPVLTSCGVSVVNCPDLVTRGVNFPFPVPDPGGPL